MFRSYFLNFQQLSRNVKIFLLGNTIQAIGLSIYSLLFNLYLKEIGYGESAIGGLISTSSLGISLMAIPAALVIEKFHVKHLVVTGMLLSSFFYFIQIFNVSESSIFTFGLLASMFQALFNISVSPFFYRNSSPEVRIHLFSLNTSLTMGSHLFGFLVGGYLPEVISWFSNALPMLEVYRLSIVAALIIVLSSNLVFLQIQKVAIPKSSRRIFEGLKDREWKILTKLIIPRLCFAFGGGLIVPFMNLYLQETFHFSSKSIGVSYAVLQIFVFFGVFVTPFIVRKTTQLKFVLLTAIFSVPFMIGMGILQSTALVLSCFFIRGTFMSMSSAIVSVFEMEKVNERECVFASAMILFSYHLVYTMSTRLGGLLIENYSFAPTFVIASSFYVLASGFYYYFFKEKERVSSAQTAVSPIDSKAA